MNDLLRYTFIRGEIISHKKRIKFIHLIIIESFTNLFKTIKQHKRTITFFKSVYRFRELGNHAQVLIVGSRNHGQRKDNAEARRRFLSLINFLLTITNFERRFTNDYITNGERNSERVKCFTLEIKTRPNERYRFSLC